MASEPVLRLGGFGYGGSYVNTANTNFTQQRIVDAEITGAAPISATTEREQHDDAAGASKYDRHS